MILLLIDAFFYSKQATLISVYIEITFVYLGYAEEDFAEICQK